MAEKTNYSVTSVILLVLLLLPYPNFCHTAENDSRYGCPDTDLTKNSINEGSGVDRIPFMKRSYSGYGSRRTLISGKSVNSFLAVAVTVLLYGSTVAVLAYLSLKSLKFSWLQMSLLESIVNPSAMDDFDEYDHIMSRRRIRARQSHQLESRQAVFGVLGSTDDMEEDFIET